MVRVYGRDQPTRGGSSLCFACRWLFLAAFCCGDTRESWRRYHPGLGTEAIRFRGRGRRGLSRVLRGGSCLFVFLIRERCLLGCRVRVSGRNKSACVLGMLGMLGILLS